MIPLLHIGFPPKGTVLLGFAKRRSGTCMVPCEKTAKEDLPVTSQKHHVEGEILVPSEVLFFC